VPSKVYRQIFKEMKLAFAEIFSSSFDGQKLLIASSSCHKLEKLLKPISFKL
jgi:hypothetical protein